jgi:pimeloyl-ACP methyl ester carboxylesterase
MALARPFNAREDQSLTSKTNRSCQFRHVTTPLTDAGYGIVAPDYRSCGQSSHPPAPPNAFTKTSMADDLVVLMHEQLSISKRLHIADHDIGGMIAHVYASHYPLTALQASSGASARCRHKTLHFQ